MNILGLAISDTSSVGEDLRLDNSPIPLYYKIKDARSSARASERQGEFDPVIGSTEAAAWRSVLADGKEVISTRAKDLEICAWMIEALVRTDGFQGLRDGLRLARNLVDNFWEGIYPLPDEDGLETTVAGLAGLNGSGAPGTLTGPISRIPIAHGTSGAPIATWTCLQAQELERLDANARGERSASGAVTMKDVQAAVSETQPQFFIDLVEVIAECLEELAGLGAKLDELCGSSAPSTSRIREGLQESLSAIRLIAGHLLPVASEVEAAPSAAPEVAAAAPGAAPASASAPTGISSREEAFHALALVAEYFRKTEPHSPMPFLIDRALTWGQMPLPELLSELIPDTGARKIYTTLTGLEIPD